MQRSSRDLERAAAAAGAELLSTELVPLKDGSYALAGRFGFEDPWAAARLLCILAEEDADDPDVQAWATAILEEVAAAYGTSPDDPTILDAFAEAVHANVQQWIAFAPEEGEQFQSARTTMIQGVGDCDCHARLVHAMARSVGAPAQIVFFDKDGEPVHAVGTIGTSRGMQWAETTIGALFGEHPQAAYRRLGLDQEDARPDIGGAYGDAESTATVAYRSLWDAYVTQSLQAMTLEAQALDAVSAHPPSGFTSDELSKLAASYRADAAAYLKAWNQFAGTSEETISTQAAVALGAFLETVAKLRAQWADPTFARWISVAAPAEPSQAAQDAVQKQIDDSGVLTKNILELIADEKLWALKNALWSVLKPLALVAAGAAVVVVGGGIVESSLARRAARRVRAAV